MQSRLRTYVALGFVVLFLASFGYLFVSQRLNPSPPANVNSGQNQNVNSATQNPTGDGPQKFADFASFKSFVNEKLTFASAGSSSYMRSGAAESAPTKALDMPDSFAGFSDQSANGEPSREQGPDYSQTNVQVAGVDEADSIKSDGSYLYIVSGNALHIVKATPPGEASIISSVTLKEYPQQIYISDDSTRLLVYGSDQRLYYPTDVSFRSMPYYGSGSTFLKVYDITDKAAPKEIRTLTFEGQAVDSRLVGDYVYFITAKQQYDWYGTPYPLPRILNNGVSINGEFGSPDFRFPDVYYFPIPYSSANITTVTSFNILDASSSVAAQHYVLENGQTIYVSPENIYITYTKHLDVQDVEFQVMKTIFMDRISAEDRTRAQEIEAAPGYILNPYERREKIMMLFQRYLTSLPQAEQENLEKLFENAARQRYQELADSYEQTSIYKIAYTNGVLTYRATAQVPGSVINQFAMDEANGYFRIATTKNPIWIPYGDAGQDQKSYNNLYILDPEMKRVGAVERLAEGERIYSVRFMQERAYMVTFEQVDPLFVIDVADPANPKVLGELKVPGFSNYLHPLDETTLIGLGKETKTNEYGSVIPTSIKISLFDVADVANPKEAATYTFAAESSDSPALYDHKAFLFSGKKNLLVIPLQVWSAGSRAPEGIKDNFMGAAVFTVTKESIALKGTVSHRANQGEYAYDQYVKRSMYIDDALYTLSDAFVKVNNLSDLAELKSIALPQQVPQPIPFEKEVVPSAPPAAR